MLVGLAPLETVNDLLGEVVDLSGGQQSSGQDPSRDGCIIDTFVAYFLGFLLVLGGSDNFRLRGCGEGERNVRLALLLHCR